MLINQVQNWVILCIVKNIYVGRLISDFPYNHSHQKVVVNKSLVKWGEARVMYEK